METALFYVFGTIAAAAAVAVVAARKVFYSAVSLIVCLAALAALYLLLEAPFIAAVQVLVYAGAIMVLFLFVIMLLNVGNLGASDVKGPAGKVIATLAGLPEGAIARMIAPATGPTQAIQVIAEPLFSHYLVPFELTSVMLLAALVG